MLMKKLATVASVVMLAATPVMAAANPAASLSVAPQARAGASLEGESNLYGGRSGEIAVPFILGVAFLLIVGSMLFDDDEELPTSP